MEAIILKAVSFFFMIVLAYFLKRRGVLKTEDSRSLAKIVMNITLPATIMTSFNGFVLEPAWLTVTLWGFLANVIMLSVGFLLSRRKEAGDKVFFMLNSPSYNIGNFTIPFAASFIGATGTVVACLYDVGNAIMCLGLSIMFCSMVIDASSRRPTFGGMVMKLLHIPSFVVYILMMLLSAFALRLPNVLYTVAANIAPANGVIAMFMIGTMLEINLNGSLFKEAGAVIAARILMAAVLTVVFYCLAPYPYEVRKGLALVCWSPISSASAAYTQELGGNASLASFTSSVTVLVSMLVIPTLAVVL
ncbi:MAG: hypothetical protein SPD11_09185 [Sphaerochaetaceae bacterium]|nr:hypothetical protein [Sphaerochaetaceae bacterium]